MNVARVLRPWSIFLSILISLVLLVSCSPLVTITPSPSETPTPSLTTPPVTTPSLSPAPTFTLPPPASSSPLPSIADVVAKVKPSVVAINVEIATTDIFGRRVTQQGAGSGWIIDENGIIVTNNHVVEDASTITVTLADGNTFTADINQVSRDALSDLAIIRINATGLPAATVGGSSGMRLGDWVVAIGNSLGRGIRVTNGIVSAQEVSITTDSGETLTDLIETTAAINPGNSGGPLVNMSGEVIGITSAKIASVGVEAVGFAISSDTALPIIQQLINRGRIVRAWLGVVVETVTQFLIITNQLSVDKGAFIDEVASGSPAQRAGLRPGDVITKFGSKDITNANELVNAIRAAQVGEAIEITYVRGTEQRTTTATLIERPASP